MAVGSSKLTGEEKEKTLPASITVLVNPAQAELLAFAISNGTLYSTLRNPVDSGKVDLKFYEDNPGTVLIYLALLNSL